MEFKFRAIDKQPSMYQPPSSSFSYFTEQAIRASNYNTDFGRNRELSGNPFDVREAIRRELEKERIREEIIAAEIARKRELEAEVRMEMMMEREMAMRRADSLSYPPVASRFEPRLSVLHQSQGRSLEERIALSLEERFGHFAGPRIGGIEPLPFRRNLEPIISEIKPPPVVSNDKGIPLATPDANLSGAKRKALTPPTLGPKGLPLIGKNKKPKEEWSCAICQVSATSEHILNEHLQGRKHKAKEAGLRAQKEGKNFGIGLIPKEAATKPKKVAETIHHPTLEQRGKFQKKVPQFNKTGESSNQKVTNGEISKQNVTPTKGKKTGESPLKKTMIGNLKKNDATLSQINNGDGSKKKDAKPTRHCASNYKFWCEMCQTGADAEIVMEGHKNGKRHKYRLQQLNKKGGAALVTQNVEVNQKVNCMENGVGRDGKRDALEKIDGALGGCPGSQSSGNNDSGW